MDQEFEDEYKDLDKKRYKYIRDIGQGSDGILSLFNDLLKKQKIAIKLLKEDYRKKEVLNEIFNMRQLDHSNIIKIHHIILKRIHLIEQQEYILKIYQVMPYWPQDLRTLIKKYNHEKRQFSIEQIRKIMYQILQAFNYLSQKVCFHRDIKPNNILVKENQFDNTFDICITDFGRSKIITSDDAPRTIYVYVKFYRAPEIFILEKYNLKSENWAIGWIFYELIKLEHPLQKAKNRYHLMDLMFEYFGTPTQDYINLIKKGDERIEYFENIKKIPQKQISEQIDNFDKQGLDLLDKLLCFDYRKRISVEEAILHPFFKQYNHNKKQLDFQNIQSPYSNMKSEDVDPELIIEEINLLNEKNNEKKDYKFDTLSIVEQEENSFISDVESENTDTTQLNYLNQFFLFQQT